MELEQERELEQEQEQELGLELELEQEQEQELGLELEQEREYILMTRYDCCEGISFGNPEGRFVRYEDARREIDNLEARITWLEGENKHLKALLGDGVIEYLQSVIADKNREIKELRK